MMDSNEYELYEAAVNAAWLKMGEANTPEEIQAVLDAWPKREDFEIDDEESKDDNKEL